MAVVPASPETHRVWSGSVPTLTHRHLWTVLRGHDKILQPTPFSIAIDSHHPGLWNRTNEGNMSDDNRDVLKVLPVCGAETPDGTWQGLSIGGLVTHPRQLDAHGLSRLAQGEIVDDFRCVSGWVAPDQRWEGVPLRELLDGCRTSSGGPIRRLYLRGLHRRYPCVRSPGLRHHGRPAAQRGTPHLPARRTMPSCGARPGRALERKVAGAHRPACRGPGGYRPPPALSNHLKTILPLKGEG